MKTRPVLKMNKGQIEALRRKAQANARHVLSQLGVKGVDYGDRIVARCPIRHHDGRTPNDNHSAFNWVFDRGIWRCFSNQCHNEYGVDIFALIRSVKGYHGNDGFSKAVDWLCKTLDVDEKIEELDNEELNSIMAVVRNRSELKRHATLEEDTMCHLTQCGYLENRGFLPETVAEFRAGGKWTRPGTYGYNRLVVPVYDPVDGYLIGFTCRTIMTTEALRFAKENKRHIVKWLHCRNFAQEYRKSAERAEEDRLHAAHILFNLHRAKEYMGQPKTIIITEGPFDVMRLWESGLKNGVAVLGSSLSKQQKELLHRVGAQRLVVCFDNDPAGNKAFSSLHKLCGNYFEVCRVSLPEGKDPGDLSVAEIQTHFEEYIQ